MIFCCLYFRVIDNVVVDYDDEGDGGGEVKTYQIWQQELGLLKMMRVMMIVRKESLSEKFAL